MENKKKSEKRYLKKELKLNIEKNNV